MRLKYSPSCRPPSPSGSENWKRPQRSAADIRSHSDVERGRNDIAPAVPEVCTTRRLVSASRMSSHESMPSQPLTSSLLRSHVVNRSSHRVSAANLFLINSDNGYDL